MAMIAKSVAGQPSGLEAAVNSGAAPIRDGTSNTFLIRDGSSNTFLIQDGTSNIHLIQDGTSNTIMFAGTGNVLAGGDHVLSGFPGDHGLIGGAGIDLPDGASGGNLSHSIVASFDHFLL
jgi:hypothetical protein